MPTSVPIAYHVTTRLEEDRVLASTQCERRLLARVVLSLGHDSLLLAFCAADTHLHMITAAQKDRANELARRLEIALQHRLHLGSPFERARARPIYSMWHLQRSLGYVHQQGPRHGMRSFDLMEATSLPDLLGMRPLGRYLVGRVERLLPRLGRVDVLSWVGRIALVPSSGPVSRVPDAACRSAALPCLTGKGREALAARRAALEVLRPHQSVPEAGAILGMSRTAVYRLAKGSADPSMVHAIRLQLGWMASTETTSEGLAPLAPIQTTT